jgi:hypothetical protein
MDKVFIVGKTEGSMRVNIRMIKKMFFIYFCYKNLFFFIDFFCIKRDKEYIHGLMEENMKGNGKMANSMVKVNIFN